MGLKVITPPTEEQISLTAAKRHLRIYADDEDEVRDDWITTIGIPAAREYCENWMRRAIAPQTFEYTLDEFPASGPLLLPMAPVTALTWVRYVDGDGAVQTLATSGYDFDDYSEPTRVRLVVNTSWPTIKYTTNAVKVRYVAGYDLEGDSPSLNPLPFAIKAAMLLVLGTLFENRESVSQVRDLQALPLSVESLLRPYQLRMSMA